MLTPACSRCRCAKDRDIEKLKFGHKDASKKEAVAFLLGAAVFYKNRNEFWDFVAQYIDPTLFQLSLDQYVSTIAMFTIIPHFVEVSILLSCFVEKLLLLSAAYICLLSMSIHKIVYQYGILRGISWALKIFTDPFTDLLDFYTHMVIHPKWFLDLKDQRANYRLDIKTKKVVKLE